MACRARGNQGNWFARVTAPNHPEIDGRDLPCIWDYWSDGGRYRDKGYKPEMGRFQSLVAGLQDTGYAIMRRRAETDDPNEWRANGYIAIFSIADVESDAENNELRFRFVDRICDLGQ